MATTSEILDIKKKTNNNINIYFKECFYKDENEKELNNIYNYLKTKKIGYGHDEELKKQKKQILYIKKKINDLIERKIIESSKIEEYHEFQKKYIDKNIYMISLYQNKTEEVEIKFNIKIDKNITYKIELLYFLLELHSDTNIKKLDSSSNEEYKQLKQLAINFKIFNDVYISDKNFESFIKSKISENIQISDGLTKYDQSIQMKLIYIYDNILKKHISIYRLKKDKSYYKIEISTKDDECECKLYLLNKDDVNFKQYLEKISKDKTVEIHYI
jgi:hypothetical protein